MGIPPKLWPQKYSVNHNDLVCAFIEVGTVFYFWYKPNLTVLKSCMMLSRSSIMVLSLVEIYSLMQVYIKICIHITHSACKLFCVSFPKVITIFTLIYLFWFKMEQTLSRFGVTRFTLASTFAFFLSPFRGTGAISSFQDTFNASWREN